MVMDQSENELHGSLTGVRSSKLESGRTVGIFSGDAFVEVPRAKVLSPALAAFTLEAKFKAEGDGVIVARGGKTLGFCMFIRNGKPGFAYRSGDRLTTLNATEHCIGKWSHIKVELRAKKELVLSVDGVEKNRKKIELLIARDPNDGMQIGSDEGSTVLENELGRFRGEMESVQLLLGGEDK